MFLLQWQSKAIDDATLRQTSTEKQLTAFSHVSDLYTNKQ